VTGDVGAPILSFDVCFYLLTSKKLFTCFYFLHVVHDVPLCHALRSNNCISQLYITILVKNVLSTFARKK
jgi:hypothetical protein